MTGVKVYIGIESIESIKRIYKRVSASSINPVSIDGSK